MKIALAQIGTIPGKIEENKNKILAYVERAKSLGADLVVFPELTLVGYQSLDLLLDDDYVAQNLNAIRQLAKMISGIRAIIGFVDIDQTRVRPDGRLWRYNSAVLIENGTISGVRDKSLLPEYDIFSEKRYFATSRRRDPLIINGQKIALQICEDIFTTGYPINLIEEYAETGVDLIINMSASPFAIGKVAKRLEWIKRANQETKAPVLYVNTVGAYDGYEGEVLFDGQSIYLDGSGVVRYFGPAFKEHLELIDTNSSPNPVIIGDNSIRDIYDGLIFSLREFSKRCGFNQAVLGLSGGIDSAVVACLACEAFDPATVHLISMPTKFSSAETKRDAQILAKNLRANFIEQDIQSLFESFKGLVSDLPKSGADAAALADENLQSRIRGTILMAQSNRTGAMLLNTGNKTELSLGYCTLYGDMNGAIAPLGDVSKLRVYELADFINQRAGRELIPNTLIQRAPSAELRPDQTDEAGIGFPYSVLSPLCEDIIESTQSIGELELKYGKPAVDEVLRRVKKAEFKRRQSPPAIRITEKSFGIGRRVPTSY
jgi:NAD+ synthase (glutamine-hydrolysing)